MAHPRVRFEVHLRGRAVHLGLAAPVETAIVRLVRLESALEPLEGRVDLRDGARTFRHRRGTVVAAEVLVDLRALARRLAPPAVALAQRDQFDSTSARELELEVRDGAGRRSIALRVDADGRDLRIEPVGSDGAFLRALVPDGSPLVAIEDGACQVRDPLGLCLRETLMPAGFRAPRVVSGRLVARLSGATLALSLVADSI